MGFMNQEEEYVRFISELIYNAKTGGDQAPYVRQKGLDEEVCMQLIEILKFTSKDGKSQNS